MIGSNAWAYSQDLAGESLGQDAEVGSEPTKRRDHVFGIATGGLFIIAAPPLLVLALMFLNWGSQRLCPGCNKRFPALFATADTYRGGD